MRRNSVQRLSRENGECFRMCTRVKHGRALLLRLWIPCFENGLEDINGGVSWFPAEKAQFVTQFRHL